MTTVDNPPSGWGSKPWDLEHADDWEAEDSIGQWLCEELDLGRGRPIMCHCTDHAYLFEAGGKFYFYNLIHQTVHEIISPKTLDEIIENMRAKGDMGLETKQICE